MSISIVQRDEKDLTKLTFAIQQLANGRSNATGTVTLTASAASTQVTATNCAAGSVVLLMPTTANAAAEIKNGTIWPSTVANGSFTITHANNSQTDRTYGWFAVG